MKLNQCDKQQRKRGEEAKRDREVLGKEKSAKAKHPPDHHHHLKLPRRVRFEHLERHENDKERYALFDAVQGTITGEDGKERHGGEHQFQGGKPKPVTPRLHPEF